MSDTPDTLPDHPLLRGAKLIAGPRRRGNELGWQLELADGRRARLAQLTQELSDDDSIRRRYRRDVARLAELAPEGVAPLLAWGPPPDHPDVATSPPWRLRPEIEGPSLDAWLEARAPAPPDEVAALLAALCRLLASLHAHGLVVRDLAPAKLVRDGAGALWLVDIGLARTDILSTRTAASLVLEGSPYTAPELLGRTAVDGRADLYAVGVLGFRALTGELPFGDVHALLRPEGPPPRPSAIRPALISEHGARDLDALVAAMLEADPSARPETASLVADVLEGAAAMPSRALARRGCQSCGAAMPVGQRLCLSCGKLAVQFVHASEAVPVEQRYKLVLRKAKEEGAFMTNLRELCTELSAGEVPALNFLIGDARMYSKAEQERSIRLPLTLFNDLDERTAQQLAQRFADRGVPLVIEALDETDGPRGAAALTRKQRRTLVGLGAVGALALVAVLAVGTLAGAPFVPIAFGAVIAGLIGVAVVSGFRKANQKRFERWGRSLLSLREAPAALPASDPLVARLAALLQGELAEDLRELVSRLALSVQRVVDHRAEQRGAAAEIELAVSALEPLVAQIEARVLAVAAIDRSLAELDEGRLVRALAASSARGEAPEARAELLDGLDRLRELEVERASALAGLAEACDLARRSVELGLRVQDPEAEHERHVRMAMRALGE